MPQCIHNRNKRDTAQQVLHGKHTLSLITAVSTGYGKREALCLFFVFWTEQQRAGGRRVGWEGVSGMAAPHEKQFTQAERANKRRRMTSHSGEDAISRSHLLISQKLERPQWQIVEFVLLPWWSMMYTQWLQGSMQGRAFVWSGEIKRCFTCNSVALSDSLHLRLLSGRYMGICCLI